MPGQDRYEEMRKYFKKLEEEKQRDVVMIQRLLNENKELKKRLKEGR